MDWRVVQEKQNAPLLGSHLFVELGQLNGEEVGGHPGLLLGDVGHVDGLLPLKTARVCALADDKGHTLVSSRRMRSRKGEP